MVKLNARLIGVAELTLDDAAVQLRRRHSWALLAYLILTARPHSREALATLLASEVTDEPARKLLRNALADLNEHGLSEFLLVTRHSVAFNFDQPHTIDIIKLDELQVAGAAADPAALAWAAEHCDRELLAGLAVRDAPFFESWLIGEREYRRQQLMQAAQRLLERQLRDNQVKQAMTLARRLLSVEPWQESVHRQLMRLLARDGQLSGALEQYERCRHDLAEELGVEPQPETTALYHRLRAGPTAPRHNLPAGNGELAGALFGRDTELEELARDLVDPDCRLLTLVGLGGSGKTSLALAAAARLAAPAAIDDHPFADGVVLVTLAEVGRPNPGGDAGNTVAQRLATAIGLALGLVFYGKIDRLDQLTAYLESKRLLLILDSLDHLTGGAPVLQTILRRAPGVTLLVASRSLLDVPEEWTRYVGGLALPGDAREVDIAPASKLFLREARRANAPLGPEDAFHIVRICELTGGSPLALKIAAGWLHAVACTEVVRQFESGGALLDEASFTHDARRTSIRELLDSVWRGLPPREQRALQLLAVFPARFDQRAADAVGVTLQNLVALSRRSLLERESHDGYVLHPLVRQHAGAQLARRSAEEARVKTKHAHYFAAFAVQHAPALRERREEHATFDAQLPNLRAAWAWCVSQRDVALLTQLWQGLATWNQLAGLHREWAETLSESVAQLAATPESLSDPELCLLLGWLFLAQADALQWQGEPDRAVRSLEEARRYAITTDSAALMARIFLREGRLLHLQGQARAAIVLLRQARSYARDAEDERLEAHTMLSLSYGLADNGDYAEAEAIVHRARAMYRTIGDRLSLGRTTLHAGRLHTAWGDFSRARVLLEQSLHISREFHDRPSEGWATVYVGIVYGEGLGRHRDAGLCFDRALSIFQSMDDRHSEAFVRWAQGRNELHVGDFSRAVDCFERALAAGRDLGNPASESRALHGLGRVALARGDDGLAEDRAEQALRLALDAERQREQALAVFLLGQARERLGRGADAVQAYMQARSIAEALALPYLYSDATAGLANVALAAGDIQRAVQHAEKILPFLHEHTLAGSEAPGWLILSCYRALEAAADARSEAALGQGVSILERRAAALPRQQRPRYRSAFPARRTVLQLWFEARDEERTAALATTRVPPAIHAEQLTARPGPTQASSS